MTQKRKSELKAFLKILRINFKNLELFNLALCHKSYKNEHHDMHGNNERLEFLGDSVLGLVVADYLYTNFTELVEGDCARIKSFVVSEDTLCKVAKILNINDYLLIGKGEALTGGRSKKAILADTYEAILGAYFLDCGNINKVKSFVLRYLAKEVELVLENRHEKDYKTLLQEFVQKSFRVCPTYHCYKSYGPEHNKTFCIEVNVDGNIVSTGKGTSKKDAEKDAAKNAFLKLSTSVQVNKSKKNRGEDFLVKK